MVQGNPKLLGFTIFGEIEKKKKKKKENIFWINLKKMGFHFGHPFCPYLVQFQNKNAI